MTVTTERLRELVEAVRSDGDPADGVALPPLSEELVCALHLPDDLPDDLPIADVARLTGTTAHTLRYYERVGLVDVARDSAGRRLYDRDALARVVFVTRLRSSDMPIQVIIRYVELVKTGAHTEPERLALLLEHREHIRTRMRDLQTALAVVDYKITTYGGACAP